MLPDSNISQASPKPIPASETNSKLQNQSTSMHPPQAGSCNKTTIDILQNIPLDQSPKKPHNNPGMPETPTIHDENLNEPSLPNETDHNIPNMKMTTPNLSDPPTNSAETSTPPHIPRALRALQPFNKPGLKECETTPGRRTRKK